MDKIEVFCNALGPENISKIDAALGFIWFHLNSTDEGECSVSQINKYFSTSALAPYNSTRLRNALRASKSVIKGKGGGYLLSRAAQKEFDAQFGHLFNSPQPLTKATLHVDLANTPLLKSTDVESAQNMAELYVITHCYENSVRKLIESTLSTALGTNWWDKAANNGMKTKFTDRKAKENKHTWISPRGAGPLFYVDWGDLVTLIRKYPTEFDSVIGNIKFVELRLEELEKIRNIIAHNGVLPSTDDFHRVVLSFKDWCKQVGN